MRHIPNAEIVNLGITPLQCVSWVRESFCLKYEAQLPPKISLHPQGGDFFNTMPCLLPAEYDRFGVKIVSRIAGKQPSLQSHLLLYKASTGELLSFMDADWITQMRTGAVAALTIQTLQNPHAYVYGFVGLGSTATATMECLLPLLQGREIVCKLLRYKQQAESFAERFAAHSNVIFQIVDSPEDLVTDTDVLVSAVTEMHDLFCPENNLYKEGTLLVPIHTRGFQNCDLFFDHIFADDRGHVCSFKYFNQFRRFNEMSEVLLNRIPARKSAKERILAYNIGLGLHDIYYANNIYSLLTEEHR